MQIEILSEVLEEGQNSAGPDTPESLRLYYLVLARAHYFWYKHRNSLLALPRPLFNILDFLFRQIKLG